MAVASEFDAIQLADECDEDVEIVDARDYSSRTYAQSDGNVRAELHAEPQWALNEGNWVDIDPTLTINDDGSISTEATVSDIQVSGGGDGPFVSATSPEGGSVHLTWSEELPEPEINGTSATYTEVRPGMDLRVTTDLDGFSYVFVAHDRDALNSAAAQAVSVDIDAEDLDLQYDPETGKITLHGGQEEPAFESGPALMWDSSGSLAGETDLSAQSSEATEDDVGPDRMSHVDVDFYEGTLSLEPDSEMVNDPNLEFPVYIDPPFSGARQAWATVLRESPNTGWTANGQWPRSGGMRVGYLVDWPGQPCNNACGLWQSAIRFDLAAIDGTNIRDAEVTGVQTHTSGRSGNGYGLDLWQVNWISNGVTYNGLNWMHGSRLQRTSVPHSNDGQTRTFEFNNAALRQRVQAAVSASGVTNISFGLRSANQSNADFYRRINTNQMRMTIEYASDPGMPTGLQNETIGCETSSGNAVPLNTQTPLLSAIPQHPDGGDAENVELRLEVLSSGGSVIRSFGASATPGSRVNVSVPSGTISSDGAYSWRARTTADGNQSSWSSRCYFEVDTEPPPQPDAVQETTEPSPGEPVTFTLQGSDDTDRFRYGLQGDETTTSNATDGELEVTVTPSPESIEHVLQVWALDEASNESERLDVWFLTQDNQSAPNVGVWRYDGDLRDDSGRDNHLAAGEDIEFVEDRYGRDENAVELAGTADSCIHHDGPIVGTSTSFTVATWVRMDTTNDAEWIRLVSQTGDSSSPFYLQWREATGKWAFTLRSEDAEDPEWQHAHSLEEPEIGEWYHLTGVYNAASQQARLYVDGEIQETVDVPYHLWDDEGDAAIGCSMNSAGGVHTSLNGAVDDTLVYQGVLSASAIEELADGYSIPAGERTWWPLRGDGEDRGHMENDLDLSGIAGWEEDAYGREDGALTFDESGCVAAESTSIRTDDSFSVAMWVRHDEGEEERQRVFSVSSDNYPSVLIGSYDEEWGISFATDDSPDPEWHSHYMDDAEVTGEWQHLAVSFDYARASAELYLDGELKGTINNVDPWRANGFINLGCSLHSSENEVQLFSGAISDVRVWQGAATPQQLTNVVTEDRAFWELGEDVGGEDFWGDNDLEFHGYHDWIEDRYGDCYAAYGLGLQGEGWAETSDTVVRTDESFTISTWASISDIEQSQTIVSQTASNGSALDLMYDADESRWVFQLAETDSESTSFAQAMSDEATEEETWYYLTAVYDISAAEVKLYVDGELSGTSTGPLHPWESDGYMMLGASGATGEEPGNHMYGVLDQTRIYQGVLDDLWIEMFSLQRPVVPVDPDDGWC